MSALEQITADLSSLGDDLYISRDANIARDIPWAAMRYGFKGLALGVPRTVPLEVDTVLPALLVNGRSATRSADLPLHANAFVVATDIDRGGTRVGRAFPPDPSKAPELPTPASPARAKPPASSLGGNSAGAAWLDFNALLDLEWQPSRLSLRVIAFDEISNPGIVQLQGSEGAPAPSGLSRGEALEAVAGFRVNMDRSEKTPDIVSDGVVLKLENTVVHAALRLRLSPASIVPPLLWADWFRLPAAIVKASILVAVRNINLPIVVNVDLPIWGDEELRPGDVVDLAFSYDLASVLPGERTADSYCAYVLSGIHSSSPQRF